MATLNGDNYKKQWVDKPSEKLPKGENAGRKRLLLEHYTPLAVMAIGDVILGPKIPASSIVIDAKLRVDKSISDDGIFDLGYLANGVDAADTDAFVVGANAGGQAVLKRADESSAGIYKRFTKETQIALIVTEATVSSNLDLTAVIEFEVEYVND